jgi:hypothetical protein
MVYRYRSLLLGKVTLLVCTFYDELVVIQGIRVITKLQVFFDVCLQHVTTPTVQVIDGCLVWTAATGWVM